MSSHLSPSQLRGARALLNWSRAELASASGISEPTLHRFENGRTKPEARTAQRLWNVFDQHGVAFLDNNGVQLKSDQIEVYDGLERYDAFYDFLADHLNHFGGDVCLSIYDTVVLAALRSNIGTHPSRMKKLFDQGKITFRILTTISDFDSYGYASFRWLPNQLPSPAGFYAFGDCLALMSFVNLTSPHIVVIRSKPLTDAYRQDFDLEWASGKKPPPPAKIAALLKQSRATPPRAADTRPKKKS